MPRPAYADDVVSTLVNQGFPKRDAEQAVTDSLSGTTGFNSLFRVAIQKLRAGGIKPAPAPKPVKPKAPKKPTGHYIYILTRGGKPERATWSPGTADRWLSLGDDYDYVALLPDDELASEPVSTRETPNHAMQRTQEITEEARKLRDELVKKQKKFPQSSLLQ